MAFRYGIQFGLMIGVAGCTSYVPPAVADWDQVAVLHGSTICEPGLFSPNLRAEPAHIDGKRIFNNALTGDQALALAPGRHVIDVSVFKYGMPVIGGSSKLDVSLLGGRDYMIRATEPAPHVNADGQSSDWDNESDIWIETAGKPVTARFPVYLETPPPAPVILIIPVE